MVRVVYPLYPLFFDIKYFKKADNTFCNLLIFKLLKFKRKQKKGKSPVGVPTLRTLEGERGSTGKNLDADYLQTWFKLFSVAGRKRGQGPRKKKGAYTAIASTIFQLPSSEVKMKLLSEYPCDLFKRLNGWVAFRGIFKPLVCLIRNAKLPCGVHLVYL